MPFNQSPSVVSSDGSPTPAHDRRRTRRLVGPVARDAVFVRLRPAQDVDLMDVSPVGARFETTRRLLPGHSVHLHLATSGRRVIVRASVLRCEVTRVDAARLIYRAAVEFEERFSCCEPAPLVSALLAPSRVPAL